LKFAFALIALLAFAAPARADDETIARHAFVGDQEIALPKLLGFEEVFGKSAQFDQLVKQFVPPENRLLAVYLQYKDMKALQGDASGGIKKYILVQTTKGDVTVKDQNDFNVFKQAIIRETGGSLDVDAAAQEMLDKIDQGSGAQLKIGESKSLGAFMNLDNALGVAMLANIGMQSGGQQIDIPIAISMSALNVKRKALIYSVYAQYADPADIEFVKDTAKEYARATLAANGADVPDVIADPSLDSSAETNFILNLSLVAVAGIALILIGVFAAPAIKKIFRNKDTSV